MTVLTLIVLTFGGGVAGAVGEATAKLAKNTDIRWQYRVAFALISAFSFTTFAACVFEAVSVLQ